MNVFAATWGHPWISQVVRSRTARTLREHDLGSEGMTFSIAFRDFQPCSTFEPRIVRGLDPVHRLKARENAPGSENPTR